MKAPKTFEEGTERLQSILERLQSGDTTVSESVKLYAEAATLLDFCNQTLDTAQLEVREIDTRMLSSVKGLQSEENVLC